MTMGTILWHIQPSVDFAKVIDRDYVRLVEPGSVLGLPAEPFLKDPVIREVRVATSFSATTRLMAASYARHTSPMPPRPNNSTKR
jgi:hypothetical protein